MHLTGIDQAGTGLPDKLAGTDPADTAGAADTDDAADQDEIGPSETDPAE